MPAALLRRSVTISSYLRERHAGWFCHQRLSSSEPLALAPADEFGVRAEAVAHSALPLPHAYLGRALSL